MWIPVTIEIDLTQGPTPNGPGGRLRLQDASGNTLGEVDVPQLIPGTTLTYGPVSVEVKTPDAPTVAKTAATKEAKKPAPYNPK